jgi:2-polyprenyl-6-methoxyphenol hydroxylase-like FAD-dependent oxidoreductase
VAETGTILAAGRKPQATERGWRWFGLKAHAHKVELNADLEMHISRDSYVGVNRIENGSVNVCGLFRTRAGSTTAESKFNLLRGNPGSSLNEKLKHAEFDESSFCSVAGLSLEPQRATARAELCIGDALTMIPPVTGNGMSMAFESAEIAAEPIVAFSRGELSWEEARKSVSAACDRTFAIRLRWARLLQRLMFSGLPRHSFGAPLLRSRPFWDLMFTKTR